MDTTESFFNDQPNVENKIFIVGIGASAGGIQALKIFFEHVPKDSGMAYVVILHLSPDHDSKLAEIIRVVAKMPVIQVSEKTHVAANTIYVVPPNQHLSMSDGFIIVSPNLQIEDRRAPVDIFFRTLAKSHGSHAICVILSGTGANGSMGLRRVKEVGGAVFVQNPREAEFNEMPRNAISTDFVDDVLLIAEIPNAIINYKNNFSVSYLKEEIEQGRENQQNFLKEIFSQLRIVTGHDFSNYKRATLLRRIGRRINVKSLPDIESYAGFLKGHPEETNALLKDLLISVTNFFRDPKVFEVLQTEILPSIIKNKTPDDELRIWVAGCATG
ncbi:MAG TPA: chemotaxis protein CheB, partial [Puia sp.]|nr:chemotaxis protein CheB [Puia sp.]